MESNQLPFLLRLIDDPSDKVRLKIAAKLREFGGDLRAEIDSANLELSTEQTRLVEEILATHEAPSSAPSFGKSSFGDDALRALWLDWTRLPDENSKLEEGLSLLARWQMQGENRQLRDNELSRRLDRLAAEFRVTEQSHDARDLAAWLFGERALGGAAPDDYYNPCNSNLLAVIEDGRGLPISLAAIFMLVGARLGIEIQGCNFPGHFLARAKTARGDLFFDCYNGGRALAESEARGVRLALLHSDEAASAELIVARVLRNLAVAYEHGGDGDKTLFVLELLRELEAATGR